MDQSVTPQLVIQDFAGVHNADLEKTSARLTKGGSWKPQRIVMVMPAGDMVPAKCVLSWMNLCFPPNQSVARILALGQEVGKAYSDTIASILAHPELSKFDYLLTIEHDNAPPADGVLKLVERMQDHPEYACIGGLYFTKGSGGVAQIWGDARDPLNFRPQVPDPNGGLVECHGTGMGFNLFRLGMFRDERLRRPWFVTQTQGGVSTQDLYFWGNARQFGYRCAIDCSVKVGHYDLEGKFGPPDTMY